MRKLNQDRMDSLVSRLTSSRVRLTECARCKKRTYQEILLFPTTKCKCGLYNQIRRSVYDR